MRTYCDMTPESRNSSLLGNSSVNTIRWKRTRATIEWWCFLWSAQRHCYATVRLHVSAAVNQHATVEEAVLSVGAAPTLYTVDIPYGGGWNNSIVSLRVVGGDEKGNQSLGYIRATLFLGDINTGTRPSRLGEFRI
jgi:hypothetical protein